MVEKKEDSLIKNQGMHYVYDGLKFKSKEELESYKKSPKKSGKGISEEKTVEDVKTTEEIAEADVIAKEKAEEKEAARIAEVDRVAQEKAAVRVAQEKAEADRVAELKAKIAEEKAKIAEEKAEADGVTEEKAEVDGVAEEIAVSKKFYIKQYIWLIIFTILWVGVVRNNFFLGGIRWRLESHEQTALSTLEISLFIIVSNGFLPTLIIWLIITKIFKRPAWKWYNWLNTLAYTVLLFNLLSFSEAIGGFFEAFNSYKMWSQYI
jgi:hypothetical protein|tara:strand:- start:683 stop:1474 length:792 start_codon:yes stop_codon:yes gene_type:complete